MPLRSFQPINNLSVQQLNHSSSGHQQFSTTGAIRSESAVPLTASKYPALARGRYARIDDRDLAAFERVVGSGGVVTEDLEGARTQIS